MVTLTIDTCVINAKGKLLAMNKLEQWHDEERIQLDVTDVMENESTPKSSQWHKQGKYVFQLLKPDKTKYPLRFNLFKNILFPSVKILNKNQEMDINQICVHLKYGNNFFVTNDRNFVRHREELGENGVSVLTPVECVEALRRKFGWA